jgi:hypothetical protein
VRAAICREDQNRVERGHPSHPPTAN